MTTNLFREEPGQRFRPKPWQPPLLSRAPSGLAMGLFAALAATALVVFATTFRFTQKEPVRGYLTPAAGWARVSTHDFAVVERCLVRSGDAVREGDVLMQLSSGGGLDRSQPVAAKLLHDLDQRKHHLKVRMDLMASQHEVDRALHAQELDANRRELARLEREISLLGSQSQTAIRQLEAGERLFAADLLSEEAVMSLKDEVASRSLGVTEKERQSDRVRLELTTAEHRLRKLSFHTRLEQAGIAERIDALSMEESRIRAQGAARILSPRDGIVASLRVGVGDQVKPGDVLVDIVPDDRIMRARLYARSTAMGSVEPGQRVRVHFDAFPYQSHGAEPGLVASIFETTLMAAESSMAGALGIAPGEPVFRIDVDFPDGFRLAEERQANLRPGMTLTADLVIERGTVVDWIVRPLRRATQRL